MTNTKNDRPIARYKDGLAGTDTVLVPLDDDGRRFAKVDAKDYHTMIEDGLTTKWNANSNGKWGKLYVRCSVTGVHGRKVSVARVILGLSKGHVVWLHDHFRDLSQAEVGLILDVSQQRVSKFLEVRRHRKEALINRTGQASYRLPRRWS